MEQIAERKTYCAKRERQRGDIEGRDRGKEAVERQRMRNREERHIRKKSRNETGGDTIEQR